MSDTRIKAAQFFGVVGHGTDGYFLMTNADGSMSWAEGGSAGPSVTSVSYPGDDTAADPAGLQTVVLTGTNFGSSMTVSIGGTLASSVAHDSSTQLTITTPQKAAGDYDIVVTNTVTGASGTFVNGISYNGVPTWTTPTGSLGTFESETTISTITLQATEPDGGTITFNITNGALPTGLSLTGANIDGTTTAESSTTLYSFTIEAIDDENQSTPRNFSITVNAAELTPSENFTINTYTGNGSTQSIEGKIGTAASFNGSSSYIDLGTDTFNTLTSYSFSCFVNLAASKNFNYLLDAFEYNGSTSRGFVVRINSSNNVQVVNYNNNTATTVTSSGTITNNTWTHIAVTNTQSNIVSSIGGSEESPVSTSGFNFHSSTIYKLGAFQYTGNPVEYHLNGKLDQVRIFNKALSSSEVTTLYGENNTSSTKYTTDIFDDGSGVALYEFEEGAKDTGVYPYGTGDIDAGQSAEFNGSSSIINLPNGFFQYTTFSVSAWVFPTVAQNSAILNTYDYIGVSKGFIFRMDSNRTIRFNSYANDSGNSNNIVTTDTIPLNGWSHVCVTYAASGSIYIYINGVEKATQATNSTPVDHHAQGVVQIGAANFSTADPIEQQVNGKIDQVRIYSSELSASNVEALASETNVPTANLVAHYKLDGNGNDETTNYNATSVNNVTYSDPAEFPLIAYNGTPTNINFLGMAFQPDLVWIKKRSGTATLGSHILHDSVRGAAFSLYSDLTNEEQNTNALSSFDSNGFTIGTSYDGTNGNGNNIVAWCWKAAGAVSADNNSDGDITSTVSANTAAGFSIVEKSYGSGQYTQSIGHGLDETPEMIITKRTDTTSDWIVWSSLLGSNNYLKLNTTAGGAFDSTFSATSTSFKTGYTSAAYDMIAYCFHSVDGYQKVGSYTGTGGAISVDVGFRPRFVMIKRATGGTAEWVILDSERGGGAASLSRIYPNFPNAEDPLQGEVFYDDGFKPRQTATAATNISGSVYIFLAIA